MSGMSEFQEMKILKLFSMLYDTNNDGVIDRRDFDELLKKISGILEWSAGSEKYSNAEKTLDTVWKGLLKYADTDNDAKITQEEWKKMWNDCLVDLEKGKFPDWQQDYMYLMFDVNDKSGDEFIDETEYTTFLSQFGISDSDCKKAFQVISGGENITKERFAGLWKEYLTSKTRDSPGNTLFGPLED
ncbi:Non-specific lipid-transfer protein [Mactra antiquata]